jgi:hypothetical protein
MAGEFNKFGTIAIDDMATDLFKNALRVMSFIFIRLSPFSGVVSL